MANIQFVASDSFVATASGSAYLLMADSGSPVNFPTSHGWASFPEDGREKSIHVTLRTYQIDDPSVSPGEAIPSQLAKAQRLWEGKIQGLHLDWDSQVSKKQGCEALGGCASSPTANLTVYSPQFGCADSVAWEALTIRFPNDPDHSNGVNFLFNNSIVWNPPPLTAPPTAIETVPFYNLQTCLDGNIVIMSNEALGYVAAHAIGHVFGLPDLHGPSANGPTGQGPNLMCSGESACGNPSQIGTYLTGPQVEKARKGLVLWQKKSN